MTLFSATSINGRDKDFLGKGVFVFRDSSRHVRERHGVLWSNRTIGEFVDACSDGSEGIYIARSFSGPVTFVLRGRVLQNGKEYGIFRTLWFGDEENHEERTGLPVFRVVHPELNDVVNGVGIVPYRSAYRTI